jgi:phage gp36-like protein
MIIHHALKQLKALAIIVADSTTGTYYISFILYRHCCTIAPINYWQQQQQQQQQQTRERFC